MLTRMARLIPKTIHGRLEFFTTHIQSWETDPAAIGLTPEQVNAVKARLETARAAAQAAEDARLAAESATLAQTSALEALVREGSGLIAVIKAFASLPPGDLGGGGIGAYARAGIPRPSGPTISDLPPPRPEALTIRPRADGALVLAWKSDLGSNRTSYYRIQRRLTMPGTGRGGAMALGEFTELTAVRAGTFTDDSLPIGYAMAEYLVTPVRQRGGGGRNGPPITGAIGRCSYETGMRSTVERSTSVVRAAA